jgi:hypothetical protein
MPFVLAGTLGGRLIGKLTDHGITSKFITDLKLELQPGTSGLIVLGSSDPERRQKIKERMHGFGGRIFESNLPPEVQEEIESEIERQKAAQRATAPGDDPHVEDSMEPGIAYVHKQHHPPCEPTGHAPRASSRTARREGCERLISGWCSRQSFPAPSLGTR